MGACMISQASMDRVQREFHAYPPWCDYQHVPFDAKTSKMVAENWDFVMGGQSHAFLDAKATTPTLTPLVFFYNTFYHKLFEMIPESKPLFTRKLSSQGKMLANLIKYIVSNVQEENQEIFSSSLQHLAAVHNERKIKAEWYSTMGLTLLYSMRIGSGDAWTPELTHAWVQLYSRMMKVIIPVVVAGTTTRDLAKSVESKALGWKHEPKIAATTTASTTEAKEEDSTRHAKEASGSEANSNALRFNPVNYTRQDAVIMTKDELRILKHKIIADGKLIADHSWKGQPYPKSLIGSTLVDWLITQKIAANRLMGAAVGEELCTHSGLRPSCLTGTHFVDDYSFYTFEPDDRKDLLIGDDKTPMDQLERIVTEVRNSTLIGAHTYKMARYSKVLVGAQLCDWLIEQKFATSREQAVGIGRHMFALGLRHLEDATMPLVDDYQFYTFEHPAASLLRLVSSVESNVGSLTYSAATTGKAGNSTGGDDSSKHLPGTVGSD